MIQMVTAPLATRRTLACDVKPHPPVDVEATTRNKIKPATGPTEPLSPWLDRVVNRGQQPGRTALLPHALVGVQQGAVAVAGQQKAAMLVVHTARPPKRQRVVQQAAAIDGKQIALTRNIHYLIAQSKKPIASKSFRRFTKFSALMRLIGGRTGPQSTPAKPIAALQAAANPL